MSLEERFTFNCRECDFEENAKQCVQICDEFAVGFAQFCWEYDRKNINHTKGFCELLEIYKQGL